LITPAAANVSQFEKVSIAPLKETISQQEQQLKTVWASEKIKVEKARNALSDWPPSLIASARKRLDDYALTLDVKIRKLKDDQKTMKNLLVTLAALKKASDNTVKQHQFAVTQNQKASILITQVKGKIATAQSNIIQLKQQVDSALKIANAVKRQAAQNAANLQAAVDWFIKNNDKTIAAAAKAEHDAHMLYSQKRKEVSDIKREAKLLKSDDSNLDAKLRKARKELLEATTKYHAAKDRHRLTEEKVHDVKQSVDRAQQALSDFQAQYGAPLSNSTTTASTASGSKATSPSGSSTTTTTTKKTL
jgi:chromosome segregation ATPase